MPEKAPPVMHQLNGGKYTTSRVDFSPDSSLVGCANEDCGVRVFETATGELQFEQQYNDYETTCLRFSPNGELLAVGSSDGCVRLVDPASGELLATLSGHGGALYGLEFRDGDPYLLASHCCSSEDSDISVWDVAECLGDLKNEARPKNLSGLYSPVNEVAFAAQGTQLVSSSADGWTRYWDLKGQVDIRVIDKHWSSTLALSPDKTTLATAGENTINLFHWLETEPYATLEAHTASVNKLDFSHDGKHLAAASKDKTVSVWDVESREQVDTLKTHPKGVGTLKFHPHSYGIVTGGYWSDDRIFLYSEKRHTLRLTRGAPALAFSPDGKILASGSGTGQLTLWDLQDMNFPEENKR